MNDHDRAMRAEGFPDLATVELWAFVLGHIDAAKHEAIAAAIRAAIDARSAYGVALVALYDELEPDGGMSRTTATFDRIIEALAIWNSQNWQTVPDLAALLQRGATAVSYRRGAFGRVDTSIDAELIGKPERGLPTYYTKPLANVPTFWAGYFLDDDADDAADGDGAAVADEVE